MKSNIFAIKLDKDYVRGCGSYDGHDALFAIKLTKERVQEILDGVQACKNLGDKIYGLCIKIDCYMVSLRHEAAQIAWQKNIIINKESPLEGRFNDWMTVHTDMWNAMYRDVASYTAQAIIKDNHIMIRVFDSYCPNAYPLFIPLENILEVLNNEVFHY
jgi:hypothetical protein